MNKRKLLRTPKHMFNFGPVRLSFITPRLIRFEYDPAEAFEDRETFAVVNRSFRGFRVEMGAEGDRQVFKTEFLRMEYLPDGRQFDRENSAISFTLNGEPVIWTPESIPSGNLGGRLTALDGYYEGRHVGPLPENPDRSSYNEVADPQGNGLLSWDGWSILDDSPAEPEGVSDFYLFCYGHDYKALLADATLLMGKQPLPPKFTLGLWWTRFWPYGSEELLELADRFDAIGCPLSVMLLDMDWHLEGWNNFTWDTRYFPAPEKLLKAMHDKGCRIAVNIHESPYFMKSEEKYELLKDAIRAEEMEAGMRLDLSDENTVRNYFNLILNPLEKQGIDFWWLDFFDDRKMVHLYWNDQLQRLRERNNRRPLVLARYDGYGSHRYTVGFSGDTVASFKTLAFEAEFTAAGNNVLFGYWSNDIASVYSNLFQRGINPLAETGSDPLMEPEEYVRWIQFGCFSPVMRLHSGRAVPSERRFWSYPSPFGEIMAATVRRRIELQDYIYTANRKCYDTGVSLCRPLYVEYPDDLEAYHAPGVEFFFGDDMIVSLIAAKRCPKTGLCSVRFYLPRDKWYDVSRGILLDGGKWHDGNYLLDEIPLFVRAGSVVPYNTRRDIGPNGVFAFELYPGGNGVCEVYEDDGETEAYREDRCIWYRAEQKRSGNEIVFSLHLREKKWDGFQAKRPLLLRLIGSVPVRSANCESIPGTVCNEFESGRVVIAFPAIDLSVGVTARIQLDAQSEERWAEGLAGDTRRLRKAVELANHLPWCDRFKPGLHERLVQELMHIPWLLNEFPERFNEELKRRTELLPKAMTIVMKRGYICERFGINPQEAVELAELAIALIRDCHIANEYLENTINTVSKQITNEVSDRNLIKQA